MIAIIGGAGFIGRHLTNSLVAKGKQFHILDIKLDGSDYLDVTDSNSFPADLRPTTIVNLAAEHRDNVVPTSRYTAVNVEGATNLVNFCEGACVSRIVFTSSVAIYGFAPLETGEQGKPQPFNEYGRTKLSAESIFQEWQQKKPVERSLVIIRPTVVFGPGNRGNVYSLCNQIHRNQFFMVGNGKNKKSMAYVENVADFIAHCTDLGPGRHVFNYVDKPDLDMNELTSVVSEALGKKNRRFLKLPRWLGLTVGRACDVVNRLTGIELPISNIRVQKFTANTTFSTAIEAAGYKPRFTLLEGLQKTLDAEFPAERRHASQPGLSKRLK